MKDLMRIEIIGHELESMSVFKSLDINKFQIFYSKNVDETINNNVFSHFYVLSFDEDDKDFFSHLNEFSKIVSSVSVIVLVTDTYEIDYFKNLPSNCHCITKHINISDLTNNLYFSNNKAKYVQQLIDHNTLYNTVLENCEQSILLIDNNSQIYFANNSFASLFNLNSPQLAYSKTLDHYFSSSDSNYIKNEIMPNLNLQDTWRNDIITIRIFEDTTERIHLNISISAIENNIFIVSINDITDRKRQFISLQAQKDRYYNFYQNSEEGHYQCNTDGSFIVINPKLLSMLGYLNESDLLSIGNAANLYANPEKRQLDFKTLLNSNFHYQGYESEMVCQDGSTIWVSENIRLIINDDGKPFYFEVISKDITQQKKSEDNLIRLAYSDTLTNLPNRMKLQDDIFKIIKDKEKNVIDYEFALIVGDLDQFKVINDSLGPEEGDLLIKSISQRCNIMVNENCSMYRIGGDSFAWLIRSNDIKNETINHLNIINESFQAPFQINSHELFVKTSLGVVYSINEYNNAQNYLRAADTALSQAKQEGGNHWKFFVEEMHEKVLHRLKMEEDIREGIRNNEFEVYYQPVVSSITGKIVGSEALTRWNHGTKGFLRPDEFIPIAEETGLIIPLGRQILYNACKQTVKMHEQFPELFISVNVSMEQLHNSDLVGTVVQVLEETKINPQRLKLEITESIAMSSIENTKKTLNTIKDLGVKFSIDDFGTGYSSLAYIHQLPFDNLKIDRIFVKDFDESNDNVMVKLIQALAKSLNLEVIAEGIETKRQLQLLIVQGCKLFQGNYFSEALSANDFNDFMQNFNFNKVLKKS